MTNQLANETSPYLLQHANNPVNWYPWGKEAFQQAQKENKPIHLSIGYASCHWCHVMAHESFENPAIAQLMNKYFINIKVDKQERPDLDDIYQKVVQMMGQGGGWPLTIFMTPERHPFFGGTYFPPEDQYGRTGFSKLLLIIHDLWENKRPELTQYVEHFLMGYQQMEQFTPSKKTPHTPPYDAALAIAHNTDKHYGGLNGAPKFPMVSCYDLVLRLYARTLDQTLEGSLRLTLEGMVKGGIFDHLGGGFSRYSVDEQWAIPHFEKMLYDNAQLIGLYANAYRLKQDNTWKYIVTETISYTLRDLRHPQGGFYASEDADSEGQEGKFYSWTPTQLKAVLSKDEHLAACRTYSITDEGNYEHHSTILQCPTITETVKDKSLQAIRQKLFLAREQRTRPGRDTSVLANWNGLMIQGLCTAYQTLGDRVYLDAALQCADFINKHMTTSGGVIYHVWQEGKAKITGFLDDYAFLANAFLDLYHSTLAVSHLTRATELIELAIEKFWNNGFYFTSTNGEQLIHRPRAPYDSAYPSGIASIVFALLRLYHLTYKESYLPYAQQTFDYYLARASSNFIGFAHLLAAYDFMHASPTTIILAGERDDPKLRQLLHMIHRYYLPNHVCGFADDLPDGQYKKAIDEQPSVYICKNYSCEPPLTTAEELENYLITNLSKPFC